MRIPLVLLTASLLAACATTDSAPDIPANAVEATHTAANGDVVSEYRVGGQLRLVRVQPARGSVYYLIDRNGDGHMDATKGDVSPVYYKIYGW